MASSEPPARTRHPVTTILLSLALFLVLDTAIFRSGFYARFQKPNQPAGSMAAIIRFTTAERSDPARDVLVTGNSKIEYGLAIQQIERAFPNAPFHLVMGAIPGSNEEYWYYALNRIDPHHDRYAAIVIPLSGYRITPDWADWADSIDTADIVTPIVPPAKLRPYLKGFTDPSLRHRALILALFASHDYASDLQNFLLHPVQRLHEIAIRNAQGVRYLYGQDGEPETMDGIRIDPATRTVLAYPPRFNLLFRQDMDQYFRPPPPEWAKPWTQRNAAFTRKWLGRIADAYKNSRTRLIVIAMPAHPVTLPALQPLPDAPDIHDMLPHRANITVVPEETFENIERPAYFLDLKHMNAAGKKLFSSEFAELLMQEFSATTTKN